MYEMSLKMVVILFGYVSMDWWDLASSLPIFPLSVAISWQCQNYVLSLDI